MKQIKNIGILGHYGNQNLGDEAIIEAMIANTKKKNPKAIFTCISINPQDSAQRYNVESFPIRYRKDFFIKNSEQNQSINKKESASSAERPVEASENTKDSVSLKQKIKKLPLIGSFAKAAAASLDRVLLLKTELYFLSQVKKQLATMDLLVICGSNQFLDNFGGAWGFPYTLLKWTMLAKRSGTRVAFVSVGAGPLTRSLSYMMLNIALGKADYLSYRDNGSKQLVESRLKKIDGKVYPDIAHSLPCETTNNDPEANVRSEKIVGINPMPVYDRRYWFEPDDKKYNSYIIKMADLCSQLMQKGYRVKLFGTQKNDADVIVDIVNLLKKGKLEISTEQLNNIETVMDQTVSELMQTIDSCDVIFATRFHAIVLPLKHNIPVIGICYYRKSSELLNEVGLGDFHVPIDNFTSNELINKFTKLMQIDTEARKSIASVYSDYETELDEQYESLSKIT